MSKLNTIMVALLTASIAFNGVTFEVEAEESIFDGGEVIEIERAIEIDADPLLKGSKMTGTYNLADEVNVTSVSDTWNTVRSTFDVQGSFVGGASEENLITLTNATKDSGGAIDMLGLFRAPPDAIMSGASEGWFRIPISIHPHQNVTLKFYHVENPKKYEIVESAKNYPHPYPEPATQMNPTMVWSETYDWDTDSGMNNVDLNHMSYTGNWTSFQPSTAPIGADTVFASSCGGEYLDHWDNTCSSVTTTEVGSFQSLKDMGGLNGLTRIDSPDDASRAKWFRTYLWWSFGWQPDEWYVYHVRYDSNDGGTNLEPSHALNDFLPQTKVNETTLFVSTADIAYDEIYESTVWTRNSFSTASAGITKWDLPIDLGVSMIYTEGLGYGMRGDNLTGNGFQLQSKVGTMKIPACPGGYDGYTGSSSGSVYGIANEPSYLDEMINCQRYDANVSDTWQDKGLKECPLQYGAGTKQCLLWTSTTDDSGIIAGYDYAHFGNTFYNGQDSSTGILNTDLQGMPNRLDPLLVNQGVEPDFFKSSWQDAVGYQTPNAGGGTWLNLEDNVHLECGNSLLGASPAWSTWIQDEIQTVPSHCNYNFEPLIACADSTEKEFCVQEPSIALGSKKSQAMYDGITSITISGVFKMHDFQEASDLSCLLSPGGAWDGGETDSVDVADADCNSFYSADDYIDTARYNKCEAYTKTGVIAGPDYGAICPVLSQYTATVCVNGTNHYCYTTQEPVGWRIYVYYNSIAGETHPHWDCEGCIVAEFGNQDTDQFVTAYVGDITEGDCERYVCEDEWYHYSASFRAFPDATGGSGIAMPVKNAEAGLCMGKLGASTGSTLVCTSNIESTSPCVGACRGNSENADLVSLGSHAHDFDTAYWYGPGHASENAAGPQYGGHCYCSFALDTITSEWTNYDNTNARYNGMIREAQVAPYGPDIGQPKATRDIPLFVDDGIVFFDKFDKPFDSTKERMTFTMPFLKGGEPEQKTLYGDTLTVNDTLVTVFAIGLDANFNMLDENGWTACSQVVSDHIICSGRDTDIDTGYYGPDAAKNAWGMAYVGDNSYDDFYDYRPVTIAGTGEVTADSSCNGDACLHGATYVKFVMGWHNILPYTSKERDSGNANNYGTYPGGLNYPDDQLQSFYTGDGFDLPIKDMTFWLHDKYGNKPDTTSADYMFLNSVYYLKGWTPDNKCDDRVKYTNILVSTDESRCMAFYQNGTYDDWTLFREHKGSYGSYGLNDMVPDFDIWNPYRTSSGSPTEYWLERPLHRTIGDITYSGNSQGGWIMEKHRNLRPFHTFETTSGTWSNLNPVEYINQFEFNVVLILDNVTYENAEFFEIYPNFIQEVGGGTIVIDDVRLKGNGFPLEWTVMSGINGANQFKELYTWLEENKRQQVSEGSAPAEGVIRDATVDWKSRALNSIVGFVEWYAASLHTLVTFIVSRLQTTISTIIDVSLFLIPLSIFAVGAAICFAWLKITVAAIRGEWDIVEQLIDGGGFLGIKAAFMNVKELREYE